VFEEGVFQPRTLALFPEDRLLQEEGAIDEQVVANLLAWPHTGFGGHLSREIPSDPVSRENVARYLTHPPIILDRIVGDPSAGKVIYTGQSDPLPSEPVPPADGSRAPPKRAGLRELIYEPLG
jgi:hypothetical protein